MCGRVQNSKGNTYPKLLYILSFLLVFPFDILAKEEEPVKIYYQPSPKKINFGGWDIHFVGGNLSQSDFIPLFHHKKKSRFTPWKENPPVDEELLKKDLNALSRALELKGFYAHEIRTKWINFKKDIATLSVNANLASPFLIESIAFENQSSSTFTPLPHQNETTTLKKGDIFSEELFQEDIGKIKEYYLNKGHYWVKVEPKVQISRNSKKCALRYRVSPGPICKIGEIKVIARSTIPKNLIFREFLFKPGDTFSPKDIINTRKALIRTRWFRLVTLKVDKETEEGQSILPLVLEIEDSEHRSIQLGVGFGSEEGPRFKGGWSHRHFLKRGWKQTIENKVSKDDISLKLGLEIPRAFRHEGHLKHEFEIGKEEEEDYDFNLTQFSSKWSYKLSERQNIHLEFQLKHYSIEPENTLSNSLGAPPNLAFMAGPHVLIDRQWTAQASPFQFQSHHSISFLLDIQGKGAGLWRSLHGFQLSFPLIYDWSFFQQSRAGWIGEIPGQIAPIPERFYSGGSSSVRGYERRIIGPRNLAGDRLGGRVLSEISFEMRHSLFIEELVYAVFWDMGQLDLKMNGLQFSDFRTAWGMGLGYEMEIGLMRLDVGFPNSRRAWESPFQIHIDFGVGL